MNKKSRGLTLIELMIALAMLAVVASLAVPSFGAAADRTRLKAAAETLAADFADARLEAAQRGRPLHVAFSAGPGWCWAVAATPGCGCDQAQRCQLKVERAADHGQIELVDARDARLDPSGPAAAGASALFRSAHGESLRVDLAPLGRAVICAPAAPVPGYPAC
jgi:type IV fimbrial biogenesis protein FimT